MIVARIILNHSRIKQAVNILSFPVTVRVVNILSFPVTVRVSGVTSIVILWHWLSCIDQNYPTLVTGP